MKPYDIHVLQIEGDIIGRDDGYPAVYLEIHPVGLELPKEQQTLELHIKVGWNSKETVLDYKGMLELQSFLETYMP